MDFSSIPTWLKSLFAAALGGFANASYEILSANPDYRKALTAGVLGATLAVLAYLKKSPLQPGGAQ